MGVKCRLHSTAVKLLIKAQHTCATESSDHVEDSCFRERKGDWLWYSPRGLLVEYVGDEQGSCPSKGKILRGEVQLLYISPESAIRNPTYRNMFLSHRYKEKLVALAVDEAHCVKTWGDEFRTVFGQVGELRPTGVNVIALTATATAETLTIVSQRLCMVNPVVVALPPYRDNIAYQIRTNVDLDAFTTSLCSELACKRLKFPKTIIYV